MIQTERDYDVTCTALAELKDVLKRLGASPGVNVKEIENLRKQIFDLQAELTEYEHSKELEGITVDLVSDPEDRRHYKLEFGERHSDYTVHLTDEGVTRLIGKLSDLQKKLHGRPLGPLDKP